MVNVSSCRSGLTNLLFLCLHSCFEETMRAIVVVLFAVLALAFVAAHKAAGVSSRTHIEFKQLSI